MKGKKINKKEDKIYGKNNFRKIATITLFESAVQWYCFLLYGTAAGTVFNKVFFSQTGNGTTALILSYMSFAIGYIAGPFGAIFFGHIGDRKGRKVTMYASLLMMGISTSIIGTCRQQQAQESE